MWESVRFRQTESLKSISKEKNSFMTELSFRAHERFMKYSSLFPNDVTAMI